MSSKSGTLYIVATPLGNLEDMTARAIRVLSEVDVIAAEDTRHSAGLLRHFGIRTPMLAVHEHNERDVAPRLLARLHEGQDIALICDAGTPLISDPGYPVVAAVRAAGIAVVAVPGANAAIAALSVAGLPTDRFVFEGFPPAKRSARRSRFAEIKDEPRTLIFYESAHRILESLQDMAEVLGADRRAVLARELTKQFETVRADSLVGLCAWVAGDPHQQKGEFVLLVHGQAHPPVTVCVDPEQVLAVLMEELPLKQAAALAARLTGAKKNELYAAGLRRQKDAG